MFNFVIIEDESVFMNHNQRYKLITKFPESNFPPLFCFDEVNEKF